MNDVSNLEILDRVITWLLIIITSYASYAILNWEGIIRAPFLLTWYNFNPSMDEYHMPSKVRVKLFIHTHAPLKFWNK